LTTIVNFPEFDHEAVLQPDHSFDTARKIAVTVRFSGEGQQFTAFWPIRLIGYDCPDFLIRVIFYFSFLYADEFIFSGND